MTYALWFIYKTVNSDIKVLFWIEMACVRHDFTLPRTMCW